MKIVMIAPQPFMEEREVPLAIYNHIKALTLMGFEVDLITYTIGKDMALPGLRIFRIPRLPLIHQEKSDSSFNQFTLNILVFLLAFWKLCHNRYDYLHTHEEAGLMGIILSSIFGKRHLYYMHSDPLQHTGNAKFAPHALLTRLTIATQTLIARHSDSMVVTQPGTKKRMQEVAPYTPIYLIENCTIDEQYSWSVFLQKSIQIQEDFTGEEISIERITSLHEKKAINLIENIPIEKVEETTCAV